MQVVKCDSVNISYDIHGVATISMQVFGTNSNLDIDALPKVFGGVTFTVLGLNYKVKQVDNSGIYQFDVVMSGIGE